MNLVEVICPGIMLAHWYVLTPRGRLQGLIYNFKDAIPGGCIIGTWALDAARIHLLTETNLILWAGLFHQCLPLYARLTLGPRQNA